MKAKSLAIGALALSSTVLSTSAQAGFFEREYHKQRLAHHIQEAAYHMKRYKDNKEDIQEVHLEHKYNLKLHRRWHTSRMHHHWDEYQEHVAKIRYHKVELAEEGYRHHH